MIGKVYDIPSINTDELVRWLENKYRRHGEIADGVAAFRLARLKAENERLSKLLAQEREWHHKECEKSLRLERRRP